MSQAAHSEATAGSESSPAPAAAPSHPRREATVRALVSGGVIGLLLAAANVYTSLKVSIIDGGGITAALLAFAFFAVLRRSERTPYGALENNITQTVASSAAVMSFVTGVVGPIPALAILGVHLSNAAIVVFGAAVGICGVFVAALLRRRLIVDEALPFPTGMATGEVMHTIFGTRRIAVRRIQLLVTGAAVAAAVTWFRDGRPAVVPQGFMLGGTFAGIAATTLGLGIAFSPLMLATGAMVGVRSAGGMLLGAAVARVVLAPWLFRSGIVANAEAGTLNSWIVWPSLGLMVAASFLPLLLDGGAIVRSFRQLAFLRRNPGAAPRPRDDGLSPRLWAAVLAVSLAVILLVGLFAFGISPMVMLIALALALLLANVAARATGETDVSPGGPVGTVALVATASHGTASGVMGGSLSMGVTTQLSQMLWAFRAGHRVGASPRAQIGAQILGVLVGAIVTVPVYHVIVSSYGLANEKMPAIAALSWKATADAMHGLAAIPRWGGAAGLIAVGAGAILTLLGRARVGRFIPTAASIGVGFMLPFSLTVVAFVGSLIALAALRLGRKRGLDEASMLALASGGMAGESIVGVIIAFLLSAGLL